MGIDTYVSRRQPPGAAPSRCFRASTASLESSGGEPPAHRDALLRASLRAAPPTTPLRDKPEHKTGPVREPVSAVPAGTCRLNLAVIVAGRWLWLEDLEGRPLASEQVQLVRSIAHALGFAGGAEPPEAETSHFDWPLHDNRQLDNSEEAAKASLTAFLQRRLKHRGCDGIVLLGEACRSRVGTEALDVPVVITASTAQMLAHPELKRRAWADLQVFRGWPA